jgi:NADH:ubiquinone oxidoreductase subunit H
VIITGTLDLMEIMNSQKIMTYGLPLLPLMIIFLISALAELNRAPFDLPEAESE